MPPSHLSLLDTAGRPPPIARLGPETTITSRPAAAILSRASGFIRRYDFTLNPYSGCSFGCDYCYARFFAPTVAAIDEWGTWVVIKENAVEALRKARLSRGRMRLFDGAKIYMSTVTDPYQPVEKQLGLTRRILQELLESQPALTVQTRSPIAERDIDLFRRFERIRVNMSITTDDDAVRRRYEPHAPSIDSRLRAIEAIAAAGVPVGISVSPMLPMRDPGSFGVRIARLNAAEYLTQYFHTPRARFAAGTTADSLAKAADDGWTVARYQEARAAIQRALGPGRPLLEGAEGFAPP